MIKELDFTMKLSNLFLPVLGLVAAASAQRQVLVTYPNDTPPSIIDQAKEAILATVSDIEALDPILADTSMRVEKSRRNSA